jgi:hypothetical protein
MPESDQATEGIDHAKPPKAEAMAMNPAPNALESP